MTCLELVQLSAELKKCVVRLIPPLLMLDAWTTDWAREESVENVLKEIDWE